MHLRVNEKGGAEMKMFGLKLPNMSLGTGIAVGAGAVVLGPIVLPAVGGALKSLAKSAIKGGIIAYEGGRGLMAETKEALEDLTAEAKSEMNEAAKSSPVAALPATTEPAKESKASTKKKTDAKAPKNSKK